MNERKEGMKEGEGGRWADMSMDGWTDGTLGLSICFTRCHVDVHK